MPVPKISGIEHRAVGEIRATDDEKFQLCGYAARFNVESKPMGDFVEVIQRGAFSRSLKKGDDVVALFNHDANKVLGRRSAGTLEVAEDEKGLKFCVQLDPDNTEHKNLYSACKRGDVCECSFAFSVAPDGQEWQETNATNGPSYRRVLKDVNLIDVSAVTYPAYPSTSVDARNLSNDELMKRAQATVDRIFAEDPVNVAKAMLAKG